MCIIKCAVLILKERMSEIVTNQKGLGKKLMLLRVKKGILDSLSIYYLKRKEILTGFLTCLSIKINRL